MKTFLNAEIHPSTLGVLYLCEYIYDPPEMKVLRELQFKTPFEALEAYANIPNAASQMASGKTQEYLFKELEALHKNLRNPLWLKALADYL